MLESLSPKPTKAQWSAHLIEDHRQSGDRGDLLSMLIEAQDTEGDGARMTDQQIRDEAMTLFLAGHETTANALTSHSCHASHYARSMG
jgi:cytochrome P450